MGKIVQMIPAAGWSAAFRDEATHIKGDTRPLLCWALSDDGTITGAVIEAGNQVMPVSETREAFLSYHFSGATSAMTK
jgi:hypothetical protein